MVIMIILLPYIILECLNRFNKKKTPIGVKKYKKKLATSYFRLHYLRR